MSRTRVLFFSLTHFLSTGCAHDPTITAKQAAAFELNCDDEIKASEIGTRTKGWGAYIYQVGVKGCGKSDTYFIRCAAFGSACAVDERSSRQKIKNQ